MNLICETKFKKDLKKIDKQEQEKIILKIQNLKDYPNIPNIKKIYNANMYRLRIGNYRVLFNIIEDTIIIKQIKHRKDIYK